MPRRTAVLWRQFPRAGSTSCEAVIWIGASPARGIRDRGRGCQGGGLQRHTRDSDALSGAAVLEERVGVAQRVDVDVSGGVLEQRAPVGARAPHRERQDRKSTRLNSSHPSISYAVFCLKKKKQTNFVYNSHIKKKTKE